ncbi:TIGR02099 family protein [Marinobacter bryozoorum]|uniref:YhdP family protein n=1 Tax=Marinobacter bryozoorum TaxID=256324 RepID=UPI002006A18A|nr:YhdP family protein [Marinobacter bryozoorum]MCK7542802.1 TIGR02099 family protein [Marinobacter bryozoorum]
MVPPTPTPSDPVPEPTGDRTLLRFSLLVLMWLSIGLLLVVAVLTSGARYAAEHIDDYRPALETLLSDRLGQEVSIDALSARWQGTDPVLQAEGVRIAHRDKERQSALSLQQLLLQLDGSRSLFRLGLVFHRMEADGLDLVLEQGQDGRLSIDGLIMPEAGPGISGADPAAEPWLEPRRWLNELTARISDPHVRLTHLTVGLRTPGSDTVFVDIPQLDLAYDGQNMLASGRAMRQGTLEQLATFSVSGQGLIEGHFTGQVWAELTPGGFFEGLTRGLQWQGFEIRELDAGARAWLTFADGQLERLNGDVEVNRIQLESELDRFAPLRNLSARVGWRRTDAGASFHVRELGWQWQGDQVSGLAGRVDYDRLRFRVSAPAVPLGPLARLLVASELLTAQGEFHLAALAPEGDLAAFQLEIPRRLPQEFHLSARLDGVSVQPHLGAPGGSNVQGQLWLNRHGGQARVDGEGMALHFPQLFAGPWDFTEAAGHVGWRLDGGITRVFARGLQVTYQDQTHLEGAFDLRLDRYGEDNLGLRVSVENGRADMLADFVPVGVVDAGLYDWLTTAVQAGEVTQGEFHGHGQIGDDAPDGSFSTAMEYRFRDGHITYDPAWPEVTDASGMVRIHNDRTLVKLDQATTGGLSVSQAEVTVDGGAANPVIDVAARTTVSGDQLRYWLAETPLGDMAGNIAQELSVSGDYQTDLALQIPLASGSTVGVDARVATNNGSLRFPAADLDWQAINGQLSWNSRQGFSTDELAARFLGHPVSVTLSGGGEQAGLTITQRGQADTQTLGARLLPGSEGIPGLEGRLPYTATMEFAPQSPSRLEIEANAASLWSEWPDPLGREAGQEENIHAIVSWPGREGMQVEARWGERLAVALDWQGQGFHGGEILVGKGDVPTLTGEPGLFIRADVASFSPAQWQPWVAEIQQLISGPATEGVAPEGGAPSVPWLRRVDLKTGELVIGEHRLPDVTASVIPQPGGWLISSDSARARGQIQVPSGEGTVSVQLDELRLARSAQDNTEASAEAPSLLTPTEQLESFRRMASGHWPEVEVRIGSLWLGPDPAGSWSFLLSPSREQVTLKDLQGNIGSLAFDGRLRWGVTSGSERTVLQGVLEGGGLQDLAALLGEEAPLTNESSVIDLGVAWPGRPDQFAAGRLDGTFSLRLEDGVILKNNETAQLFRLFNLLNTDTLQRRLTFDFSDLYEAGVAFDAISGKGNLRQGVLTWDPDLQLAGPSGALRMSGSTNLADRTLDMRLVVVLPLTQNLPLAAILMGASPPVGGALFVLDKLLGEPLSKLTSATYSVGGTWGEPDVDLRNIFDTGGEE